MDQHIIKTQGEGFEIECILLDLKKNRFVALKSSGIKTNSPDLKEEFTQNWGSTNLYWGLGDIFKST